LQFTASTKNSNTHCTSVCRHKAIVAKHVTGVLFLVQFDNFDQTMGFYWSYTLLL